MGKIMTLLRIKLSYNLATDVTEINDSVFGFKINMVNCVFLFLLKLIIHLTN